MTDLREDVKTSKTRIQEVQKLQQDMQKLQQDMEKRVESLDSTLKGTSDVQRAIADQGARSDQLATDIQLLQGRLEEINFRMAELSQKLDDKTFKISELSGRMDDLDARMKAVGTGQGAASAPTGTLEGAFVLGGRDLLVDQLLAAARGHFLAALGRSKGSLIQVNLTANTSLQTVEEFKRLAVRQQDGAIVRLGEIADIVLGAEDYETEVRFSGQTAVFMGIWPLPNADSIDVIRRMRAELSAIQKDMPTGLKASVAYDATDYINNAIREVLKTLGDTLLIVVIVIFLFLGSFRSVLVPVVAIPVSLIGGVLLMQVFGFTVNLLTLLAIVLSVGLVVDDAIVVVENVARHIGLGKSPREAALAGARELVNPIIAMTITLAAVYLPIGLQGGLTGSLFREFAFTLAGAVAVSGIVALTLSPVMSAWLLKPGIGERGLAGRISRGFARLKEAYGRRLDATLRTRPAVTRYGSP